MSAQDEFPPPQTTDFCPASRAHARKDPTQSTRYGSPFADQADWLSRRRAAELRDLQTLKSRLDEIAGLPIEHRSDALSTILRQAAAAFRQLERIDGLLATIAPNSVAALEASLLQADITLVAAALERAA